MVHYYVSYSRLRRILAGEEPSSHRRLKEIAEKGLLVELKCPRCSRLFITDYRAGALHLPCPSCREKAADGIPAWGRGERVVEV